MDMFSSFEPCNSPHILMGNNTYMKVSGKGSIDMGEGTFNDVLCVPSLSTNLLSIYQITHGGQGKIVEFTPDRVYIRDLETRDIVAIEIVDHSSHVYSFSHFSSEADNVPLTASHTPLSVTHISEEKFDHLHLGILETYAELPTPPPSASSAIFASV